MPKVGPPPKYRVEHKYKGQHDTAELTTVVEFIAWLEDINRIGVCQAIVTVLYSGPAPVDIERRPEGSYDNGND